MATPPKEAPKAEAAGDDPQKVDFDFDPEVKKQLQESGSYRPNPEKSEYVPPGPHPLGGGLGGSSGGVKAKAEAKK
jgi:hypothetical protein